MAINELLLEALTTTEGYYWYIAPTYRQAKTIAWQMLVRQYYKLPQELRGDKNEAELSIIIGNGSKIELKGADNEDSLRGIALDSVVLDEVASYRNWKYLWQEVLRPSLTDKQGKGLFISTPKGYNHFYQLFQEELRDTDYKSFRFTSYENPFLSHAEIEKARKELTEDSFAQEYLAEFRKFTGVVYKEFDRVIHVIEDFNLDPAWQYYRAMDFGGVNPTVCLWIAVDNYDTIYVYDEYYHSGEAIDFHANVIKGKSGQTPILATWGDPSGAQQIIDYGSKEIYIAPAIKASQEKDWVLAGIAKVREYLRPQQNGKPRLYIFKKCQNTIREFESYHWLETRGQELLKDRPDKIDDHCMDALRYFMVSYQHQQESSFRFEDVVKPNVFTGY